jgi:hypothetical protein
VLSEALDTETTKNTIVFEWHEWFRLGQENVEDVGNSDSQNHAHLMKVLTCIGSCVCEVSHLSLLYRNIDKVALSCVFKRSDFNT